MAVVSASAVAVLRPQGEVSELSELWWHGGRARAAAGWPQLLLPLHRFVFPAPVPLQYCQRVLLTEEHLST